MWQKQRVKLNSTASKSPVADVLISEKWVVTAPAPTLFAPRANMHCLSPSLHSCISIFPEIVHCLTQPNTAGGVFCVCVSLCVCAAHGLVFACTGWGVWGGRWGCCVVLLKLWSSLVETSCHLTVSFCLWNSGNETDELLHTGKE